MTDDITLKITEQANETAINELHRASFSSLLSSRYDKNILEQIVPIVSKVSPALLNSGSYYMALNQSGEIVGCGGWTHEKPGTNDIVAGLAHIRHFSTHPNWINQGIGRKIYNQCKKEARQAGINKLSCYSTMGAENFYKALGFMTIKTFELAMGEGLNFPTILMEADI